MTTLEPFREHENRSLRLTAEEAELLRVCRLKLKVVREAAGLYRVGATRYVGTDEVAGLRITVIPKLPVDRLLYLLGVYPEGIETAAWTEVREEAGALEALVVLFAHGLDRALSHGLPASYEPRVEDLQQVRGKLDFHHVATARFGLFPPLRCRYDDYTTDIEPNRRLLAAARTLQLASECSPASRALLGAHAERLAALVAETPYPRGIEPIEPGRFVELQLGRGARDYRAALDLANVALRGGSVEWTGTGLGSLSFVVNMDKVFEKFVCRTLEKHLASRGGRWREEETGHLDRGRVCEIRPDTVWRDEDGNARMVVDAKWKQTESGRSDDIKQLVLYCTALGLRRGALVYGSATVPAVHRIANTPMEIHVLELPVDGPLEQIEGRVAVLAEKIEQLATDNRPLLAETA